MSETPEPQEVRTVGEVASEAELASVETRLLGYLGRQPGQPIAGVLEAFRWSGPDHIVLVRMQDVVHAKTGLNPFWSVQLFSRDAMTPDDPTVLSEYFQVEHTVDGEMPEDEVYHCGARPTGADEEGWDELSHLADKRSTQNWVPDEPRSFLDDDGVEIARLNDVVFGDGPQDEADERITTRLAASQLDDELYPPSTFSISRTDLERMAAMADVAFQSPLN